MTMMRPVQKPDHRDTERLSTKRPTVSVICTVFNGERYLDQTIQSVLGQEFTDWELVLFDDGSTDRTRDIVMMYARDPRIRYIYHGNIAQSGAAFDQLLNTCMGYVTGEYVAFIGADDVFMPRKLSAQMAALKDDPATDILFSDGSHIDAEGRILATDFRFQESLAFTSRNLLRTLFRKNIVPHPTVLIRRRVIEDLGGFETGFCPDYQFWLKAAGARLRFKYMDEKLVQYRIHPQGISTGPASKTGPETVTLLSAMRARVEIQELYPELSECADQQAARYGAHVDFGLLLLTANIPCPQLAVEEFRQALVERGDGLEAINNLGVLLALFGLHDKAEMCFRFVHETIKMPRAFDHNLQVMRRLATGQTGASEGFILLRQTADDQELLRRLDPVPDMVFNAQYYGGKIASIVEHKTERISGESSRSNAPSGVSPVKVSETPNREFPMVSVIMPTHNRIQQLRCAIASVLAQTYQDFEIIVVSDAGSSAESELSDMNTGGRITYVRHAANRGLAAARNTGLKLARGKYIAYLDDDDRFFPDHLETLVNYLETHDECVAYTDAWRVHEKMQGDRYVETSRDIPYSYDFDAARLLISNYFPVLSVMHERVCLEAAGLFDEALTSHEDWDLWIRISRRYPFKHLKKVTAEFTWRTDGSSMTSSRRPDFARTAAMIYEKHREVSKSIPGVREMQDRALQEYRALLQPAPSCTCSIIIPVWNKLDLTRQCLSALAAAATDVTFEVIIVDNGSVDGTKEFLAGLKGNVQIVSNEQNLGFAKGCNQGARVARGKYLVFLNNDTVPQPGWLSALVSEVDVHPEVGIVGSKLLYPDGTIQHAGVVRDCQHLLPYHIYKSFAVDHPAVNQRREFQIVTAACLLIRGRLFEEVGGFDEEYVNGFEDADLCLKVKDRGHLVVYQPRSVVVHFEGQTPGRNMHENANAARFLKRWGTQWWTADEDRHFHIDGYKLKRIFRNGQLGGDIQLIDGIKDRAAWAHVAAAQTAALKQDWQAVRHELALAEDWPNDRYVLSWGAMVAEKMKEPVLRVRFLSRYLALVDAPAERAALVRTLLEQKNFTDAESHLRMLLDAAPDHAEGLLLSGILSMQREQYQQAEAAFASALRQGADRKKCLMGMGMAAMGRAYAQGAWERFRQVLAEHPDDAEAIHWLLRAGTAQNRWQEVGERLRHYLSRNPADLSVRFALTGVLVRGEQIVGARQEYETLRALAPTYDGLAELEQAIAGKEAAFAVEAAHL